MYATPRLVLESPSRGLWSAARATLASLRRPTRPSRAVRRYARALWALDAGAEGIAQAYAHALSIARDGGDDVDAEGYARTVAKSTAVAFGRTEGVDILRELNEAYLDLWIERLITPQRETLRLR